MGGDRALADCHVPHLAGGKLDLADDEVDDAVHEIALVRDVVVQRHRLDPELPGEFPHRERLDAGVVREPDCGVENTVPAEGPACLGPGAGVGCHGLDRAYGVR